MELFGEIFLRAGLLFYACAQKSNMVDVKDLWSAERDPLIFQATSNHLRFQITKYFRLSKGK